MGLRVLLRFRRVVSASVAAKRSANRIEHAAVSFSHLSADGSSFGALEQVDLISQLPPATPGMGLVPVSRLAQPMRRRCWWRTI